MSFVFSYCHKVLFLMYSLPAIQSRPPWHRLRRRSCCGRFCSGRTESGSRRRSAATGHSWRSCTSLGSTGRGHQSCRGDSQTCILGIAMWLVMFRAFSGLSSLAAWEFKYSPSGMRNFYYVYFSMSKQVNAPDCTYYDENNADVFWWTNQPYLIELTHRSLIQQGQPRRG